MKSPKDYTADELAQITYRANEIFQAGWLEAIGNLDNVPGIGMGVVECVLEAVGEYEKGQQNAAEGRKDG